jgi:hypothetical protein
MTGDAHGIIAEVAWKLSKRRSVQWHRVRCSGSQTKVPFIRYKFSFTPHGHSSLLFFTINRTIGLLWEHPSPTPLT